MDDDWFEDSERLYPEGMDGPTIDPPSVDTPSVAIPEPAGDVFQRSPIARLFLLHVVVWNAVVLLVSLGAMLIFFRNDWNMGGRLLVAGGVLTLYGLYRWPRGTDDDDATDGSESGESAGADVAEGQTAVETDTDANASTDVDATDGLTADEPAVDS
jgi:hypothetical protein